MAAACSSSSRNSQAAWVEDVAELRRPLYERGPARGGEDFRRPFRETKGTRRGDRPGQSRATRGGAASDYVGSASDSSRINGSGFISDFGPFFAGVVALGIAGWGAARERLRRPSLSLSFDPDDPYDYMTGVGTRGREESHWLRLRVENARGKRSAEDVEVLLVEVRGGSRGPRLGGVPLVWADAASRDDYVTRLALPPGLPRRVQLLAVVEPPDDPLNLPPVVEGETDATAELQVWPAPADGRHTLGSGEYELILAVVARDTDSREYRVTVTHDGKWWTAEHVKQHLRAVPPKRLSRRRRALEAGRE